MRIVTYSVQRGVQRVQMIYSPAISCVWSVGAISRSLRKTVRVRIPNAQKLQKFEEEDLLAKGVQMGGICGMEPAVHATTVLVETNSAKRTETAKTAANRSTSPLPRVAISTAIFPTVLGANLFMGMVKYARDVTRGISWKDTGVVPVVLSVTAVHLGAIRQRESVSMVARAEGMVKDAIPLALTSTVLILFVISRTVMSAKNPLLPLRNAESAGMGITSQKANA